MSRPADNISIARCFQFVPGGDNEKSCWQHFACPYCHHWVEFTVLSGYIQRRLIISMESVRNFNCFSHQTENSKIQPADKDASLVSIWIILSRETCRKSLIYCFHFSAVVNTRLRLIRFIWGEESIGDNSISEHSFLRYRMPDLPHQSQVIRIKIINILAPHRSIRRIREHLHLISHTLLLLIAIVMDLF